MANSPEWWRLPDHHRDQLRLGLYTRGVPRHWDPDGVALSGRAVLFREFTRRGQFLDHDGWRRFNLFIDVYVERKVMVDDPVPEGAALPTPEQLASDPHAGQALRLPLLSADSPRDVRRSGAEEGKAEKDRRESNFRVHLQRLADAGDARATLARRESDDPAELEAIRSARAAIRAEWVYKPRTRNKGAVTAPGGSSVTPAPAAPTSAPNRVVTPGSRSGSLSSSPDSAASTAESERERETPEGPDAREVVRVTDPVTPRSVTPSQSVTESPVTAAVPTLRSAEQLALEEPAAVGQFFLDVMAARAPEDFQTHANAITLDNLGRVIVAQRASEADLRAIGGWWRHDPKAARQKLAHDPSVDAGEKVKPSFLVGARMHGRYEGAAFGTLLEATREWLLHLPLRPKFNLLDPPFRAGRPGVVGTVDAIVAQRDTGTG